MRLMVEAAAAQPRVLAEPAAGVLTQFGESGIDLELGFWISDPEEGKGNVRSEINLAIWRGFRANGMHFPSRSARCAFSTSTPAAGPASPN